MARVLHVVIPNEYDLAMTFVRMQEWYESPKFGRKLFTLEAFMRWYSGAYGKGCFTYPKDWGGFNVPSTAVTAIMNGPRPLPNYRWEDAWSDAESKLFLALCRRGLVKTPDGTNPRRDWNVYRAPQPFYLIGTTGFSTQTLPHEKAHGRFFVYPDYQREVLKAVRAHDTSLLANKLLNMGYSQWTLEDEVHAYALTGWPKKFKPNAPLVALRKELRALAGSN
jgi:hypothetical protein